MSSHRIKVSSSKIKDAIGTICQFLTLSGFSGVSPETFRQAKFDRAEAIGPLLLLLEELLEYSNTQQLLKSSEVKHIELIPWLHVEMLSKHYTRVQFYRCLDINNSTYNSSRELLIAIGWLINRENILKVLMKKEMFQLPSFPDVTHNLQKSRHAIKIIRDTDSANLEEQLNQLIWNIGKCRMSSKQLYWKQQELVTLAHKINKSTRGVSLTKNCLHLSPADVCVIRYEEKMKQHLTNLEKENKRLQVYAQWQEKAEIFWQWMESVIDSASDSSNTMIADTNYPITEQMQQLDNLHSQLSDLYHHSIQRVIEHQKPTQKSKLAGHGGANKSHTKEELDGPWKLSSSHKPTQRLVHLMDKCFQLEFKEQKTQSQKQVIDDNRRDIKEEIHELLKEVKFLKSKLLEQRGVFSGSCSDVLTSHDDVVSIPPISCN